jgi:hypothetical protein
MTTDQQIERLRARVAELEELCAAAYQFAGALDAPEAWLDALWAASQGGTFSAGQLLPISAEACGAVADLHEQLEDVRRIVAVGPAAAELGRVGGQRRSAAKRRAARANGRKGGRPRKQAAPTR